MTATIQRTLTLDLVSYWHPGTGRGDGPGADALLARTAGGLPYLPGRSLKGLLRAATHQRLTLGHLDSSAAWTLDHVVAWFGSPSMGPAIDPRGGFHEEWRHTTRGGSLRIGSARIGTTSTEQDQWESWAEGALKDPKDAEVQARLDTLTTEVASTRMNERGLASDRTLRVVEVAVPLVLCATVEGPSDDLCTKGNLPRWVVAIQESLPLLRALGSGRNRGFGRVKATLA